MICDKILSVSYSISFKNQKLISISSFSGISLCLPQPPAQACSKMVSRFPQAYFWNFFPLSHCRQQQVWLLVKPRHNFFVYLFHSKKQFESCRFSLYSMCKTVIRVMGMAAMFRSIQHEMKKSLSQLIIFNFLSPPVSFLYLLPQYRIELQSVPTQLIILLLEVVFHYYSEDNYSVFCPFV